jgi:pyruvate dehydrogenase E2 component (dihydrolipoamide acetyltransferase)
MAQIVEVKVPDIGDFKDVPIIELLVKVPATRSRPRTRSITLESDKATMDIACPVSPASVTEFKVKVGDKVAEGTWSWPWKTSADGATTAPSPQCGGGARCGATPVQAIAPIAPVAQLRVLAPTFAQATPS